jgi:hypothetical protein
VVRLATITNTTHDRTASLVDNPRVAKPRQGRQWRTAPGMLMSWEFYAWTWAASAFLVQTDGAGHTVRRADRGW